MYAYCTKDICEISQDMKSLPKSTTVSQTIFSNLQLAYCGACTPALQTLHTEVLLQFQKQQEDSSVVMSASTQKLCTMCPSKYVIFQALSKTHLQKNLPMAMMS
jgi:hypothetical protein